MTRKRTRRIVGFVCVGLLAYLGLSLAIAFAITWPRTRDFEDKKEIGGHAVEAITVTSQDGVRLSAWLIPGEKTRGVVLASGIGSDRRALVRRGEFYASRGFTVMMPDLRGTGKSSPEVVTVGWEERMDLIACVQYLRDQGVQRVGVNGISLGASAIAYSFNEDPKYDFVVLESCYDRLDHAWRNRLALFSVPHVITWPARWLGEVRIGRTIKEMAPIDYLKNCSVPTLVLAGDDERFLKLEETQGIFDAVASKEKQLHIFSGGHHEDFLRRYEDEFKATLGSFLDKVDTTWRVASK